MPGSNRWLIVVLLAAPLLALPGAATAQDFAPDPRVDSVFARYDRLDTPGCAVGAYRNDRMIYARGYGAADLERRVPITPRSVFDIGSTSKQFAAATVALLAQEGKLSIDDDVRKHIPELPTYDRPITIRHLLHHTSGLRDYLGLLVMSGKRYDDVTTPDDALRIIARQRALNFSPGDEHLYSNSGYFLLSIIVERVAGRSLRDEARARIFEPLGMRATSYLGSYDDIIPDRALAYDTRGDGFHTDLPRWLQLGDGAVFTSVEDLLLWDRNFYEPKVGGRALIDTLLTRGRLNSGEELDYAKGLMHEQFRGQRVVSHGGSWGGYRAELIRFPDQHYSVAVLCNLGTTNPSGLARQVAAVHLADALDPVAVASAATAPAGGDHAPAAVAVPEPTLRAYAGTYRRAGTSSVLTVAYADGALRMVSPGSYALRAQSLTQFAMLGAPVNATMTFDPLSAGATSASRLRWQIEGRPEELFDRIELSAPSAAELAQYAGDYRSEELDAVWRFALKNGTLTASFPGQSDLRLRPLQRDEFSAGGLTIRFQRNEGGTVVGAALDQGRIRNLGFVKLAPAR